MVVRVYESDAVNPMQVQRDNDPWNQPGDWMDVVLSTGTYRQRFLHYNGTVMVHCHWLTHEDMGCIGRCRKRVFCAIFIQN